VGGTGKPELGELLKGANLLTSGQLISPRGSSAMKTERKYKRREARNLPGHAYLLTFSTRRRKPYLKTEQICVWLSESISKASIKHDFKVIAYVLIPDHVHLLVHPRSSY
jgi:hypothetical protein